MPNVKKTLRITLIISSVGAAAYFVWLIRSGLYPFFLAIILAYLLNQPVQYFEKKGLSRTWSIFCVYLLLFFLIFVAGGQLAPVLIHELDQFGRNLPAMIHKSEELLYSLQFQYQHFILPDSLRKVLDDSLLSLQNEIQNFIADIVALVLSMFSHIIGIAISPILAFYLLKDSQKIKQALMILLPLDWKQKVLGMLADVDKVLSGVIRGQITVAVVVGLLVSVGLVLLGVPYAILIGIFAGVLDVIPYFGAFFGATPAITLALLESPLLAGKVAVLFFVIHQLEGSIIGPQIIGDHVGLHPLSVIFFLFAGQELLGLYGMLLAVPVAAVMKVIFQHFIKHVLV